MNVGISTPWGECGAAIVSRQYRRALEGEHNVLVYVRGHARRETAAPEPGVTWGAPSRLPVVTPTHLPDLRRWVRRHRIEAVLFNEEHWWGPVLACSRMGVLTGAYVDYYTEATLPLFACYDFLVCNTRRHYEAFRWHPQAYYVPWGTDLETFRPQTAAPVSPGVVTFFHSCGVSPLRKGTDLLLQAFAGVAGPARLVIHSQAPLPELLPAMAGTVRALETAGRLVCCSRTVPAPGLYHLGDVYVYPSRLDGIGLTVPEALASGLPVITSDHPPMNEMVSEESGKLVRISRLVARGDGYYWPQCVADVDHLRQCMQAYVAAGESLPAAKAAARRHAERCLDWQENSRGLAAVLAQVRRRPAAEKLAAEKEAEAMDGRALPYGWRWPELYTLAGMGERALRGAARCLRARSHASRKAPDA